MKSQEQIEALYRWQLENLRNMEEYLADSYALERQGRILQDEVRQVEMRYNTTLAVVHTLQWALQVDGNEPF